MTKEQELHDLLIEALDWIDEECQPNAEFYGEGHNWNMDDEDRARARDILARGRSALDVEAAS